MKKAKLFLENFLIYGLGGVISKIIPLIMVPVVTRIMPDSSYFGISDMSHTIVSFGSALAIMGMYDAMYRMFFEKDEIAFKKQVCSTTMVFTMMTSIVLVLCMAFLRKPIARYFFGSESLVYVVDLSTVATLVSATNSIISAPTRMQNKRSIFLIANTAGPVLSYSIHPAPFEGILHYRFAPGRNHFWGNERIGVLFAKPKMVSPEAVR